jgi:hypothetical protein
MGGNVVKEVPCICNDTINISTIDLKGALDGVPLTVQVTDSQDKLIATTTTDYTKG